MHPQVEVKTVPYKERDIHQQHPVTPPTYLGPCSSETDWPRVEKYDVVWSTHFKFGNRGHQVLQVKEKKEHPDCWQCKVEKSAAVMVWGSGHLDDALFRDVPVYFSMIVPTVWLHSKRVWVRHWLACSLDLSHTENFENAFFVHYEAQNMRME